MSTESPWRPAQDGHISDVQTTEEELASPSRPWPKSLVALVALLVGVGLGHLTFGATADDVRAVHDKLDTANARLKAAGERLDASRASVKRLSGEEADRDAVVVALAGAFDANPQTFESTRHHHLDAVDAQTDHLLNAQREALNAWHLNRYFSYFTEDAKFAFYLPDGKKYEWTGEDAIREALMSLGRPHLRQQGPAVQSGDLVWNRYVEDDSSGVEIRQIQDDHVSRTWIVITGPGRPAGH